VGNNENSPSVLTIYSVQSEGGVEEIKMTYRQGHFKEKAEQSQIISLEGGGKQSGKKFGMHLDRTSLIQNR
jgi:hypothetical protein